MDLARWHARQALDIDNSLAEAHTSTGVIKLRYDWDWQQAELEFKTAIEMDPESHQHIIGIRDSWPCWDARMNLSVRARLPGH